MPWRPFLLALALLATACGAAEDRPPAHTLDGMVLSVTESGGLAPVTTPYRPPQVAVYSDGRVVESERYRPARARIARISTAAVDRLADRAAELGLDESRRVESGTPVADGIALHLSLSTGGHRAYTVIEPGADAGDLKAFAGDLALDRLPGGDLRRRPAAYRPDGVAVLARPATGTAKARAWPLAAPAATPRLRGMTCQTYHGAGARKALRLLGGTPGPVWRADGRRVTLVAYPLLPYESACPDLSDRPDG